LKSKHLKSQIIAVAFILLAGSAQAEVITQANRSRVQDNHAIGGSGDGVGDAVAAYGHFGYRDHGSVASQNFQAHNVFAFLMTGISTADAGLITAADFSVVVASTQGTPNWNTEVHAVRTAATSTILASDYQTSAATIASNFGDGNGVSNRLFDQSGVGDDGVNTLASADQANLVTYLQNNWVENDYVFISMQESITGGENEWYNMDQAQPTTLTVVPEPSSLVLLLVAAGSFLVFRRRK